MLGPTIEVKVGGFDFLIERTSQVEYFIDINGKFGLNKVSSGTCYTYHFSRNWWVHCSDESLNLVQISQLNAW